MKLVRLEQIALGTRGMNDPPAVNLTQVILHSTHLQSQLGEQFMPAFDKDYSDADIAALVYYVTGRFGASAATITHRTSRGRVM